MIRPPIIETIEDALVDLGYLEDGFTTEPITVSFDREASTTEDIEVDCGDWSNHYGIAFYYSLFIEEGSTIDDIWEKLIQQENMRFYKAF